MCVCVSVCLRVWVWEITNINTAYDWLATWSDGTGTWWVWFGTIHGHFAYKECKPGEKDGVRGGKGEEGIFVVD